MVAASIALCSKHSQHFNFLALFLSEFLGNLGSQRKICYLGGSLSGPLGPGPPATARLRYPPHRGSLPPQAQTCPLPSQFSSPRLVRSNGLSGHLLPSSRPPLAPPLRCSKPQIIPLSPQPREALGGAVRSLPAAEALGPPLHAALIPCPPTRI